MIRRFYVTVDGRGYEVEIEEVATFPRPVGPALELAPQPGPRLAAAPMALAAGTEAQQPPPAQAAPAVPPAEPPPQPKAVELPPGGVAVSAPMPGKILSVKVTVGQSVKRGDVMMILEAMKMENEIQAPTDGMVSAIAVESGQTVDAGAPLASIG